MMDTTEQAGRTCSTVASDAGLLVPISKPQGQGKRTTVYIQDDCLKHRYIRTKDFSGVVERPERLRAVKIGLSAAIARAEEAFSNSNTATKGVTKPKDAGERDPSLEADMLAVTLERMQIGRTQEVVTPELQSSVSLTRSKATVDLLNHPAVKYVHGDIDGDVYLENLIAWARDSRNNIAKNGIEFPPEIPLNPADVYLCPTSIDAIQGAIGAVCEAIDTVLATGTYSSLDGPSDHCERAFVAIRPPGHHCGEDTPCGFCFVNNVVIGTAHAHLKHGIKRVVILDIDLHHGNGTQSLIWQINEETYRQTLEHAYAKNDASPGLQVYYGSLHDILSFPCEEGKPNLVQAASTSIHGAHGQHIENIHLQQYESNEHFWGEIYPKYLNLIHRARDFLDSTGGPGDDILLFVSCGFDAGEHEYSYMSRHNRKVPTSFYHRFTRDACAMADQYARGRLVSVLEGGYSDRALIGGAMAHLCGLVDLEIGEGDWVNEEWWNVENLTKLEEVTKARKGPRSSQASTLDAWVHRTSEILATLEPNPSSSKGSHSYCVPPSSRTLRGKKKGADRSPSDSQSTTRARSMDASARERDVKDTSPPVSETETLGFPFSDSQQGRPKQGTEPGSSASTGKKLPRVILHVRPPAERG